MLIMNCNSNKKCRSKAQSPLAERRLHRLHFIGDFAENGLLGAGVVRSLELFFKL